MATKLDIILDLYNSSSNKNRFSCPFCYRLNSLSIQDVDGNIRYNCFGADCRTKGIFHSRLSFETIQSRRIVDGISPAVDSSNSNFIAPDHFVSVGDRPACREYIIRNNCLNAWANERIHLRYDPKLDRIVFLVYDSLGKIVNATGRTLKRNSNDTKWYIYGKSTEPFIAGHKNVALLVEDCASAASISHLVTGIGLLGTNFKDINLTSLRKYKRVILALDKDALRKALELENSIRYFADTSILLLNEDLKALDSQHLFEFLGKSINLNEIEDL